MTPKAVAPAPFWTPSGFPHQIHFFLHTQALFDMLSRLALRRSSSVRLLSATRAAGAKHAHTPAVQKSPKTSPKPAQTGAAKSLSAPTGKSTAKPTAEVDELDDDIDDRAVDRKPLVSSVEVPCAFIRLLRVMSDDQYRTLLRSVCKLAVPESTVMSGKTIREVRTIVRRSFMQIILQLQLNNIPQSQLVGITSANPATQLPTGFAGLTAASLSTMPWRNMLALVRQLPNWHEEFDLACRCLRGPVVASQIHRVLELCRLACHLPELATLYRRETELPSLNLQDILRAASRHRLPPSTETPAPVPISSETSERLEALVLDAFQGTTPFSVEDNDRSLSLGPLPTDAFSALHQPYAASLSALTSSGVSDSDKKSTNSTANNDSPASRAAELVSKAEAEVEKAFERVETPYKIYIENIPIDSTEKSVHFFFFKFSSCYFRYVLDNFFLSLNSDSRDLSCLFWPRGQS
jgi:hypothetical protein